MAAKKENAIVQLDVPTSNGKCLRVNTEHVKDWFNHKTKLCCHFANGRKCPKQHGWLCAFAHGVDEQLNRRECIIAYCAVNDGPCVCGKHVRSMMPLPNQLNGNVLFKVSMKLPASSSAY